MNEGEQVAEPADPTRARYEEAWSEQSSHTAVPATPRDALQAAYIAQALTESFQQGRPIDFDARGEPIL